MNHPKFPARLQGSAHDTVSMYCCDTEEQVQTLFRIAQSRLLDINHWHELSDQIKADFQLCDQEGFELREKPSVGNLICINIPGPGHPSGHGYDWVRIIEVEDRVESDQYLSFTIQPCGPPNKSTEQPAHFYEEQATNTFVVRRVHQCIMAEVHGRNEVDNTQEGKLADRVRNQLIAWGGKLGMGKIQ